LFLNIDSYESSLNDLSNLNNANRAKRLAQETVTLSNSLPLSFSSSVFVRCNEERLDVMKVCKVSGNYRA
jgi:baculoviral IAP repeat-containing protein 6